MQQQLAMRNAGNPPRGRFRTSLNVVADTFKDIYGIQPKKGDNLPRQAPHMVLPDQKTSEPAPAENQDDHPKFRKWLGRIIKYGYWFGLSQLASHIGKHIGQSLAFTAIIYHPFFVSSGMRLMQSHTEKKAEARTIPEHEGSKSLVDIARSTLKRLGSVLVPDRATQVLTFCVLEMVSTPIFISVIEAVAKTSASIVSPFTAAAGVVAGTCSALAVEYSGYRAFWKNVVLRGIGKGGFKDDLKGFLEEFRPLRLFGQHTGTKPADTSSEYVGQTYGVMESYWVWIQGGRLAIAAGLATMFDLTPAGFIGAYMGVMLSWYGIFVDLMLPMYIESMKEKLSMNNRHLGLDGER